MYQTLTIEDDACITMENWRGKGRRDNDGGNTGATAATGALGLGKIIAGWVPVEMSYSFPHDGDDPYLVDNKVKTN